MHIKVKESLFVILTVIVFFSPSVVLADAIRVAWSSNGKIDGFHCIQIHESRDPDTWGDNFLCTKHNWGLAYSPAGPIKGMRCTRMNEPLEPPEATWRDNYLCIGRKSDLAIKWSHRGKIPGMNCVNTFESRDSEGWSDNYLCFSQDWYDIATAKLNDKIEVGCEITSRGSEKSYSWLKCKKVSSGKNKYVSGHGSDSVVYSILVEIANILKRPVEIIHNHKQNIDYSSYCKHTECSPIAGMRLWIGSEIDKKYHEITTNKISCTPTEIFATTSERSVFSKPKGQLDDTSYPFYRIEVRCKEGIIHQGAKIDSFAYPLLKEGGKHGPELLMSKISTAVILGMPIKINFKNEKSAEKFGCSSENCRKIVSVEMEK